MAPKTPLASLLEPAPADVSAGADPWAPDPRLDGVLAANLTAASEAAAAADAATALQESGFGSALHTALGELRRIAVDPVPVPTAAVPASAETPLPRSTGRSGSAPGSGPDRPVAQPTPVAERFGGSPAGWLTSLGDWWTTRWRELLPGMVVVALVVVAFAVVLATGGKRVNTSHVDTRRPLDSGPSTTIAGLFSTAAVPPADTAAPDRASSAATKPTQSATPVTTKASSDGPATSSPPAKSSNPSPTGGPAVTSPPDTQVVAPPNTTPDPMPATTTTTSPTRPPPSVTTTTAPPDPPPVVCARRPELC